MPDSTAQALGGMIIHTLEAMALVSLVAAMLATVFLVAGLRKRSRRPMLYRLLGILFVVIALIPPAVAVAAINSF